MAASPSFFDLVRSAGWEVADDLVELVRLAWWIHGERVQGEVRDGDTVSRSTWMHAGCLQSGRVREAFDGSGLDWDAWVEGLGLASHGVPSKLAGREDVQVNPAYVGAALDALAREGIERPLTSAGFLYGIALSLRDGKGGGRIAKRLEAAGADLKRLAFHLEEAWQGREPAPSASTAPRSSRKPAPSAKTSPRSSRKPGLSVSTASGPTRQDVAAYAADAVAERDALGRRGFARALALRMGAVWRAENPEGRESGEYGYAVQLDGPWGSGKTTLLEFVARELAGAPEPWAIVRFNAWKHQRLDPPWWALYRAVLSGGLPTEPGPMRRILWRDFWWRVWHLPGSQPARALALVGAALVLILIVLGTWNQLGPSNWATAAKAGSAVLALGMTLFALLGSRSSPASAKRFEDLANDSMGELRDHYRRLVKEMDRPILVLVDDLDRCEPGYVVRLVEGIQTLFSHSRVFWIMAADRRWLTACFEEGFAKIQGVAEPGRPLGRLFLAKAFQLEVSVPGMHPELKLQFLNEFLGGKLGSFAQRLQEAEGRAHREFSAGGVTETLGRLVDDDAGADDVVEEMARRQAAIVHLAGQEPEEETEHYLSGFVGLMESNPRSIKRLTQAYGMNLAVVTLYDPTLVQDDAQRDQLVRWTILGMRWPALADAFAGALGELDTLSPAAVGFEDLEDDPEVMSVLEGVDEETVKELVAALSPRN